MRPEGSWPDNVMLFIILWLVPGIPWADHGTFQCLNFFIFRMKDICYLPTDLPHETVVRGLGWWLCAGVSPGLFCLFVLFFE